MLKRADELRSLLGRAFCAHGADNDTALLYADVLVEAELRGRSTHGLNRTDGILTMLAKRRPGKPEIVTERGPLVHIDGRGQSGYVVADMMADVAARVATKEGHALVGARNTRHCGMLGYYANRVADQDVIGLMFADCCPLVAPWGGAEAVLGTNPIAAAFPWEPHNILIDMGTSATTHGAIDWARRNGFEAPPESAVDAEGRFTTDPNAVHALLPFGRHKGYALGLMVQLLAGAVVGAAGVPDGHTDYGLMLVAVRPDLFAPREHYESQIAGLIRRLKSVPLMAGHTEILIPGERAFRERERRLRHGIEVPEERLRAIEALAGNAG